MQNRVVLSVLKFVHQLISTETKEKYPENRIIQQWKWSTLIMYNMYKFWKELKATSYMNPIYMKCTSKHTQKQHSSDQGLKDWHESHFHESALNLNYRNVCTTANLLKQWSNCTWANFIACQFYFNKAMVIFIWGWECTLEVGKLLETTDFNTKKKGGLYLICFPHGCAISLIYSIIDLYCCFSSLSFPISWHARDWIQEFH